nr:DUF2605 domain-containing protein [Oscillatoria sp. FACHB-1406]
MLGTVLGPLLEDFQYWFARSRTLLESEKIDFLSSEEQADLLARIKTAQQEVSAAQLLFRGMDGNAGIEVATLMPWHNLLGQCWRVAMRWRSSKEQNRD